MNRPTKPKVQRKKKPTNLTLSDGVKKMAAELLGDVYGNLVALVEDLIRRKHEAVFGVQTKSLTPQPDTATGETIVASVKRALNEPSDPVVPHQGDNPQNKIGDTTKRGVVKKKRAKKPQ